MSRSRLLLFAILVATGGAAGRVAAQVAVVTSNDPQALVYADSTWLGPASRGTFELPQGTRLVRVVPSAVGSWGVPGVQAAVIEGDTVRVSAHFPITYRLEGTPFSAQVYQVNGDDEVLLGTTPVVLHEDAPLAGELVFRRAGFSTVSIQPGTAFWNHHQAVLQPLAEDVLIPADVRLDIAHRSRRWIDYAALGAATVGGILAVHYKIKADNRYAEYSETGDPTLRPRIEQLDDRSAIALGAMQAGVGVFALRLVFR
ncbi:MAG: hypothetical protein ACI80V_001574 [Rhodothermales bacterium]|jgi:hypothetical protein